MAISFETDLPEFLEFAQTQLENRGCRLTPEEVLDLWRTVHPTSDELSDSATSVQRALDQADRGEGDSWEDFDRAFRARHQLPADE